MAQSGIDIDYNNIETNRTKLTEMITEISGYSSTIKSAWGYLNGRVQNKVGSSFDCQKIEEINEKITKVSEFLKEVLEVYKSADLDLSAELTMQYLEVVYPEFQSLSDERKAILLSAIRYLGLKGPQVEEYASNFKSQYVKSQFVGDTSHAWCAMFVGSLINYFYGSGTIVDKSYASVWKIFGDYNDQSGLVYETDPRIQYYMSEAAKEKYLKYLNADGTCGLANWQSLINKYNQRHGTNIKISDWYSDEYSPMPGDIIALDMFKAVKGIGNNDTLSDYNTKTDYNKAVYLNTNNGTDFPGATSAYSHVAFVFGTRVVDGVTYVDTIDGNYSNDVQIRSYRIDDPRITGYGHIEYEKFQADQSAVQKVLSEGIDLSRSHAKISNASRSLLAFDSETVKSNYLNTMANNVFGTGTTPAKFVKTLQQNTSSSTQDTAVQTSTQATTTDKTKNATQLINNNQTTTTTTTNTSNNTNYNNNYSNNNNYNYSSSRSTRSNTSSTSTTTTTSTQTTETTKVDETATQEYTEKVVKEIESESASIFKRNNEILESIYGNKPTTEQVLEQVDVSSSTVSKPTSVLQTFKPQTTVTDNKPEELAQAPESVPTVEDKTSENIVQQQPEIKPDPVVEPINNEPVVVSPQPEQNQNVVENITNTGEQIITNEQPVISAPSETPVVNPTPEETVATEPLNPREAETVQRPNESIPEETTPVNNTEEQPESTEEDFEEDFEEDYGDDDSIDEDFEEDYGDDDSIDEEFEDEYEDTDIEYRNDDEVYVPKEQNSSISQTNKPEKQQDNKDHTVRDLAIAGAGVAAVAAAGVAIGVHNKKKRERG